MKQNNVLELIIGQCFNRSASAGILTDITDKVIGSGTREMTVVSVNEETREVELAFSSEAEVEQWFGIEILDHSPGAVDMSRIADGGAPLLVDHNWRDQVGVVTSARIDGDRIGRAIVKFSRSQRGEEIFQDVKDKIRQKVSVGYKVMEAKVTETRDGGNTDVVTITRWLPYEISVVSVPADNDVGFGRIAGFDNPHMDPKSNTADNPAHIPNPSKGKRNMKLVEKTVRDARGQMVRAMVDSDDGDKIVEVLYMIAGVPDDSQQRSQRQQRQQRKGAGGSDDDDEPSRDDIEKEIRERNAEIFNMGETYQLQSVAARAVSEGKTVDQARQIMLDAINEREEKQPGTRTPPGKKPAGERGSKPLGDGGQDAQIGLSEREIQDYSMFRLIRALAKPQDIALQRAAEFEFECSRAAAEAYGKEAQGAIIPDDILRNFMGGQLRALNANQGAANTPVGAITGENLVAHNFYANEFIGLLRNNTTIMRLARTMPGLVGMVDIPKQTGGATAYWIGEHEDAPETIPTFGQIELKPHTVAAFTDITRRLLKQSTPDAENIVRADLAAAVGLAIDYAGYYGTGTGNEPRGIKNYSGINAVTWTAAEGFSYEKAVEMESEIAADNADVSSMAYVLNARARGKAKTTPKFIDGASVAGAGVLWEPGNTLNGYRTEVTNQLVNNDVFFGNFADLLIGMWGGLDLTVDPYTLSRKGALRLVVFQDVDFGLRRVESFTYGTQAAASGG